ncbi:MAG: response regulator [Candidatus Brocadiia bacterium]
MSPWLIPFAKRELTHPILLVVDDDPSIRKIVAATTRGMFATILEASTGEKVCYSRESMCRIW